MSDIAMPGVRHGRSPAYPYVSLRKALSRVRALYDAEGKHAVPPSSAYKAWGIGTKSSGARQTLAALKLFGLVTYLGKAKGRRVRVSDFAVKILLDKRADSPGRDELIRRAALNPPIYTELWQKYGADLPSDATIETYLLLEREFNENAVSGLIADFKDTLELVKLSEPDKMPFINEEGEELAGQSVSAGQAVEMDIAAGVGAPKTASVIVEREFLRNPLSPDCSVRLLVTGPITSKELRKLRHLIYFLELWHDLEEGEQDELAQKIEQDLDKASEPS